MHAATIVNVSLIVDVFRLTTPIAFWTRGYNGRFGGAPIRVPQGGTLRITLVNRLDGPDNGGPLNWFRNPNTTNLHLHGLHVSPSGKSDDVFRAVPPNTTAHYEYKIPIDHPAGLYWYHPHTHGSSSLQQGGGMAGALVIDPIDNSTIPPALLAMEEEILLLQHLCFYNDGKYAVSTPYINHLNVIKYGLDNMPPRPVYRFPNEHPDYYLVNGVLRPNITMRPGQWKRLRIIGAGTSAFLELHLIVAATQRGERANASSSSSSPPPPRRRQATAANAGCEILMLAKDGIYVTTAYAEDAPLLVPGGRIDVAVRCATDGTYSLISMPTTKYSNELAETTVVWEGVLLNRVVGGAAMTMASPSALPPRPAYMPDLRNSTVPASQQLSVALHSLGGPYTAGLPFPQHLIAVNGNPAVAFSSKDAYVHNMSVGVVEEWGVGIAGDSSVAAGNHPFHVHVNPYQIVSIDGYTANYSILGVAVGEYRDTIPLWLGGRVLIRFQPDRYTGRALIHCHMIPHVDLGMAAVAYIGERKKKSDATPKVRRSHERAS